MEKSMHMEIEQLLKLENNGRFTVSITFDTSGTRFATAGNVAHSQQQLCHVFQESRYIIRTLVKCDN